MSNERRRAARQDMQWKGLMLDTAGAIVGRCMMVNVSATGAKLILPEPTAVPDSFVLILAKNGDVRRFCDVTWRAEHSIGVRFVQPTSAEDEEVSFIEDALARLSEGH
jgi:hypothetical protein